jgi:competence protein ComFC
MIQDVKAIAIYDYDEHIKQLIYLLKGCYDIELSAIFLNKYIKELKVLYHDHIIVPAPSSLGDDEHRGFNHVVEIFKVLNLPIARNIVKKFEFKQSNLNFENRNKIRNKLSYVENVSLYGKNVLIVDDVSTTGSTLKAIVEMVKCYQPKRISILIIAKVNPSFD